jgi:hypothetical protein
MDVIIREHEIRHAASNERVLLSVNSIEAGLNKYVTDVITTIYGERLLGQIFRLNKTVFTNKDVQLTFRVGAQSARTRIQSWENAGIIKLTGTRAAEGALGGKPANEYTIVDTRIERVMKRQLVTYDPYADTPELPFDPDEEVEAVGAVNLLQFFIKPTYATLRRSAVSPAFTRPAPGRAPQRCGRLPRSPDPGVVRPSSI